MTQQHVDGLTAELTVSARMPDLTVFFFDLESELERLHGLAARDSDRLRAFCRSELEAMGSNGVLIFGATGFYLVVRTNHQSEALMVAKKLDKALGAFLGIGSKTPESSRDMFRIVRPAQVAANEAPRENVSHEWEPAGVGAAAASPRPRDSYAELALRGTLSDQNVELTFAPVNDLRRGRATTFICVPAFCVAHTPMITGYRAFDRLDRDELPLVDRAILAHSLKFARRLAQENVYAAVGAPVSFETLVSSRGRSMYQEAMLAAGVSDCPYIYVTVRNVPSGVTVSRLADIIGSLRPFVRRVFVELPDVKVPIDTCGFLGASGFSLGLPPGVAPGLAEEQARWLVRVCESQTALSCIELIDEEAALEAVRKSGVRYGAGSAFGQTSFRGNTHSLDVEAFMRAASRGAKTRTTGSIVELRRPSRGQSRHLN